MAQYGNTAPVRPYRGRFAPSPTGPLHAGSLVAALASWLDARAHGGRWLVRIEDVDTPRCVAGASEIILEQLAACGLHPDEPVVWQSHRFALYQRALDSLVSAGHAYPCACSRSDIEAALARQGIEHRRNTELVYPGTCRDGLHGRPARAWRLRTQNIKENWHLPSVERSFPATNSEVNESPPETSSFSAPTPLPVATQNPNPVIAWNDRRLGPQQQNVSQDVGDYVLRRADGLWAYQLAVVVDDADQGITDIVRGEDLADNTPRQILLQRALGLPTPRYLHTPLVLGANGEKLSKQNGALALETRDPLAALSAAGRTLGLAVQADTASAWLASAIQDWRAQWCRDPVVARGGSDNSETIPNPLQ